MKYFKYLLLASIIDVFTKDIRKDIHIDNNDLPNLLKDAEVAEKNLDDLIKSHHQQNTEEVKKNSFENEPSSEMKEDPAALDNIININENDPEAMKEINKHIIAEGDMLLDDLDKRFRNSRGRSDEESKRVITSFVEKLWRTRDIPYVIDHYGTSQVSAGKTRQEIVKAMATISNKSCLKFRPKAYKDKQWLRFYKGDGCFSGIGRKFWSSQATEISLGNFCVHQSTIIHEILHALGFYHEQSRPDRDSFINIRWSQIQTDRQDQFDMQKSYTATAQGTPYDYQSIMHYGNTAFTKYGQNTIEAKFDKDMPLGGSVMSELDILELNRMYGCEAKVQYGWSSWTEFTECFKDSKGVCTSISQRFCVSLNCPGGDEYGVDSNYKVCDSSKCSPSYKVFQPHWGNWGAFSQCSRSSCGYGIQTRTRACNNPPPNHNLDCHGVSSQTVLCRIKSCQSKAIDNNFDKGFGQWHTDNSAPIKWKLIRGSSPGSNNGPVADHTSGYGQYACIIPPNTYVPTRVGRLISRKIEPNSGKRCFTFYYQMDDKDIKKLEIFIRVIGTLQSQWKKEGHQGNYWLQGAFDITDYGYSTEIIIEATLGYSNTAIVGIDDIIIDNRACFPSEKNGCVDDQKDCETVMKNGHCVTSFKYYSRYCCATCSGCSDDQKYAAECKQWANNNECKKNQAWMGLHCCKSCLAKITL